MISSKESDREAPEVMIQHIVQQGECIFTIGRLFGLTWEKLWDLNAELQAKRNDPNILFPGDIVLIPETQLKEEPADTNQRHVFVVKDDFPRVRVQLLLEGFPRPGEPYRLVIGEDMFMGVTDENGILSAPISSDAPTGSLFLTGGVFEAEFLLQFGFLDPVTEMQGIQERLDNLGFDPGPIDGIQGPLTTAAIERFQTTFELEVDGIAGPVTQGKLVEIHGC